MDDGGEGGEDGDDDSGESDPLLRAVAHAPPASPGSTASSAAIWKLLGPAPGTQIGGRYRIEEMLGRGGMGAVFAAVQEATGRRVAIKLLRPDLALDAEQTARFEREARASAQLEHPHVVDVLDFGREDGRAFLVMELLRGETLGARLRREGPLAPEAALAAIDPILSGLAALHRRGWVHRDVKPENVFLAEVDSQPTPRPTLLDFGLVLTDPDAGRITASDAAFGTAAYMAPEQLRSARAVGPAADQYAAAVVLYEALVGRLPFEESSHNAMVVAKVTRAPIDLAALRPDLPAALCRAVMRALSRDPADRFPDLDSFRAALRGETVAAPTRRRRRGAVVVAVLGLALAGVVIVAAVGIGSEVETVAPAAVAATPPPARRSVRITSRAPGDPAGNGMISPDGLRVAYVDARGPHVLTIATGEVVDVPVADGARCDHLSFVPGADRVVLAERGERAPRWARVVEVDLATRARTLVRETAWEPAFATDGRMAYVDRDGVGVLSRDRTTSVQLVVRREAETLSLPVFAPGGRHLAVLRRRGSDPTELVIVPADGSAEPRVVLREPLVPIEETHLAWLPDGRLVYAATEAWLGPTRTVLRAIRIDPERGTAVGAPEDFHGCGFGHCWVAGADTSGHRLLVAAFEERSRVMVAPLRDGGRSLGAPELLFPDDQGDAVVSGWTHDSSEILLVVGRAGTLQPGIARPGDPAPRLLAPDVPLGTFPIAAPNGGGVLFFQLDRLGPSTIRWTLMRSRDGAVAPLALVGTERLDDLYFDRDPRYPPLGTRLRCGAGGCIRAVAEPEWVVFSRYDPAGGNATELGRAPLRTAENAWTAASAEDGRIALLTHEPRGRPSLRLLDGREAREIPLPDGCLMHSLDFAPDGALLAVCASPGPEGVAYPIWRFDPATGEAAELWRPQRNTPAGGPHVSPDGARLAWTAREVDGDLWVLESR